MFTRRTMLSRFTLAAAAAMIPGIATKAVAAEATRLWTGFSSVVGMAFDASGTLFMAEWGAGRISRVAPDGSRTAH